MTKQEMAKAYARKDLTTEGVFCPHCTQRMDDPLGPFLAGFDAALAEVMTTVNEQAEDDGLWFIAATAPEAYLQQELRKLHRVIEKLKENQNDRTTN